MTQKAQEVHEGLEGVIVTETALSMVDGQAGRLVIRDYSIEELAGQATFEEICGLMWRGELPDEEEHEQLRRRLGRARTWVWDERERWQEALSHDDGMSALQAAIALLDAGDDDEEAAFRLVAAVAVVAAAWARRRRGEEPTPPDPSASHAEDLLRMTRGGALPTEEESAALDTYWTAVVDHGMNASTFTARVVASTGAGRRDAVLGAISALKGPLHGGAPGPVLDMLDAISSPKRAAPWLEAELEAGRRIMGMGHRVYRVRDPRASVLEKAARVLERAETGAGRLALARAVEEAAERLLADRYPDRSLRANVEFYTAVLLEALGLPRELFSPMFAASRSVGWCAHIDEQRHRGRLIRPKARYLSSG